MDATRVLIADADEALADVYCRWLAGDGFEAATAGDASGCLARLMSFCPHVLVLDPELPPGGGDEVLGYVYGEGVFRRPEVIVLAEGRDLDALFRAAAFPVQQWHDKPFPPVQLSDSIHRLLSDLARCEAQSPWAPGLLRREMTFAR